MKQPFWKRALSYIIEIPIESTGSEYNAELNVQLVKGRYQLSTHNAIYSFADKYDNFLQTFRRLNMPDSKDDRPIDVLLLGFGLGSIPYMLENIFDKKYSYTAVEIDEEVLYLASKYVVDELKSDIRMVTADAHAFMEMNDQKYDIICMDIFESDIVPEIFQTEAFLHMLQDSLGNDSLLIYNRLYQSKADQASANSFFSDTFLKVFKEGRAIQVEGNKMLLNDNRYLK